MAGATRGYHATDPRPRIATITACAWFTAASFDVVRTRSTVERWNTAVFLLALAAVYAYHAF